MSRRRSQWRHVLMTFLQQCFPRSMVLVSRSAFDMVPWYLPHMDYNEVPILQTWISLWFVRRVWAKKVLRAKKSKRPSGARPFRALRRGSRRSVETSPGSYLKPLRAVLTTGKWSPSPLEWTAYWANCDPCHVNALGKLPSLSREEPKNGHHGLEFIEIYC